MTNKLLKKMQWRKWRLLLFLPFILGANQCQLAPEFKQAVEDKITKNKSQDIHITVLPIADRVRTPDSQRVVWHISHFLANGMNAFADIFNHSEVRFVFYDKKGIKKSEHAPQLTSKGRSTNVHQLVKLIENTANDQTALLNSVIKDYMNPLNADILLTGQYKSANNEEVLDVFLFFKPNKACSRKTIAFSGQKLMCKDSKTSEEKLCDGVSEKIGLEIMNMFIGNNAPTNTPKSACGPKIAVSEPDDILALLPGEEVAERAAPSSNVLFNRQAFEKIIKGKSTKAKTVPPYAQQPIPQSSGNQPPSSSSKTIYITQLSFVDISSYTSIKHDENEWINTAVQRGIQAALKRKSTLAFNAKNHAIQNDDTNFLKFLDTFYDPNKGIKDALQAVIKDIMAPNGVDILVTGEYEKTRTEVKVKAVLLLRSSQSQVAKELQFKKSDFECIEEDIWGGKTKGLCSKALRDIENAVADLLAGL